MDNSKSRSRASSLVKELDVIAGEVQKQLFAITKASELRHIVSPHRLARLVALKAFLLGAHYGNRGWVKGPMEARVEAHFEAVGREILQDAAQRTGA